ncbi:M16 family metallopeptidase [Roseovarius sp. C7]|uniref:M16 family metallopeptidase n=1 Tax=Roseovarius sp. C7 TaxID=3398643 RepID=UPI0039F67310
MIRAALFALGLLAALPARAEVDIQEITTPGGITAWLVEEHSNPFVALELRFRGGTSLDSPETLGAMSLMTHTLEEGAGEMDANEFATRSEELAASFSYNVYDDVLTVSAKFLTENRDDAIEHLRESLVNPRFDQDALDRVRGQMLLIIQSDAKDPRTQASRALDKLVFGDHPYSRNGDGTLETVAALDRDNVLAAHQAGIARDRLYVSAVGDITADELSALLDRLLGDLPETGAPLPGKAELNLPGGTHVTPFATPQSVAVFAQPGIDRDHEDFFAAFILNHVLGGGGFESRLMTEVREKRGLTYGVYSYLANKDNADLWAGSVASANDRVAEAIEVIRAQWDEVRRNGITAEELEDAKTYLTGAYPLRFDGNGPIANIAVGMQMDDLPIDYIATRNDKVMAVTLEDVNRVAREYLDPDALTFVVVGQPEGLMGDTAAN